MEKKEVTPEKNCYSAEELQFFKELILQKREEAVKNLELLNEAVAGSVNDVNDTAPTFKTLEEGSNVLAEDPDRGVWPYKMCVLRIRPTASAVSRASSSPRSA